MKFFRAFLFAAIVVPVLFFVHVSDPYTAKPPDEIVDYRVLEESDVRPTAEAMLLTGSTSREEVSNIVQDYASRHGDSVAVKLRVVDERQELVARAYYCFEIAGAGTTGLSPGERRFEYRNEIKESHIPMD